MDPAAEGFFWLAGQGGFGIMTSPAAARTAASLIVHGSLPPDLEELGLTEEQLIAAIATLNGFRREYGREGEPFEISAGLPGYDTPDGYERLEEIGVTEPGFGVRNADQGDTMTLQEKLAALRRVADEVLAKRPGRG